MTMQENLALACRILGFNTLGNELRDRSDPKSR